MSAKSLNTAPGPRPPAPPYDIIVIGLGAMGCAATYHAATRGLRVLGIDQFPAGHAHGSSHGHHRMIRRSTYRAGHAALIDRAFELWPRLEQESDCNIMNLIGEVSVGFPREAARYQPSDIELTMGGNRELLDDATLVECFPGFQLHEGMIATYEREAGFLRPEIGMAAHLEVAERRGATIVRPEAVVEWSSDHAGVTVRTERETYVAERLIITAGPWAPELLGNLNLPLQPVRIVNGYFRPERPDLWTSEHGAPDFLLDVPEGEFYGMPSIEGVGLKIGRHDLGQPTTPRTIRRDVEDAEIDYLRNVLDRYMPGASGEVTQTLTCMYTMTPDENYIVERHPEFERVVYGCGFSGTGYKFSCVIGEILVDLAQDGRTRFDVSMMESGRFRT